MKLEFPVINENQLPGNAKKLDSELATKSTASSVSIEKARRLLEQIPADLPYPDWMRVAAALKNEGVPKDTFMEWSRTSPQKFDEAAAERVWDSAATGREGEITMGTLVYLAEKYSGGKHASTQESEPVMQIPFVPPPSQMMDAPSSDDECVRQVAETLFYLFKPGENFEFCIGRTLEDGKRVIPDRVESVNALTESDAVETLVDDNDFRNFVLTYNLGGYISKNPVR